MAKKIFNEFQGNTIRIGDTCYTFIGETTSNVNSTPNEIDGTYASCLACEVDSSSSFSSSSDSSESIGNISSSSSSMSSESLGNDSSSSSDGVIINDCVGPCNLTVQFKTYMIPDGLKVFDDTGIQLDTGFISTGNSFNTYSFTDLACPIRVCVNAPNGGTAWELKVDGCGMDIDTVGGQIAEICYESPSLQTSSSSSSTENVRYNYELCDLFTESISSSSNSSSSSSSSSSSVDSSSSSSSSGAGAPAGLATCNCVGESNEGKPRVKVTITGINAVNRSGSDGGGDFVEWLNDGGSPCKYYEGTPVLMCADVSLNDATYEQWKNVSGDIATNGLLIYAYTTYLNSIFINGLPGNPANFGLQVAYGGTTTQNFTNTTNLAAYSPSNYSSLVPKSTIISDVFFGSLTTNNADPLTVKWERHCGHPDTTTEWKTGC